MKMLSFFIFLIIKVSNGCEDINKVNFMPPFKDVRNVQIKSGEDLSIVCCHPDGAESLNWLDKSKNPIQFESSFDLFSMKDEKNRLILKINNLDKKKIGEYSCINNKRRLTKSIIISVQDILKPEIKEFLQYFPNKQIKLKCPLTDNQEFKEWKFKRGDKDFIIKKSVIDDAYEVSEDLKTFIVKTDGKKANIYAVWCIVQEVSSNGDIKRVIYHLPWIIYEPIDIRLVIDHKGPILESDDVKLICYFKRHGFMTISFPHNAVKNANFKVNSTNFEKGEVQMIIKRITKDSDGEYECKIYLFLSQNPLIVVEETAKVKVDVLVAPKIISNIFVPSPTILNINVNLSCKIKSKQIRKENVFFKRYLETSSSWVKILDVPEKYEVNLTTNEINIVTLLIKNVTWDDRGEYMCIAKNAAGEDSKIGVLLVKKPAELISSTNLLHMATKPEQINCSVSGYPINDLDSIELRVVSTNSPISIRLIDRYKKLVDGLWATYEVVLQGELTEGMTYKLECYYINKMSNLSQKKGIELKLATKPDVPQVIVLCSGSSGIVFQYRPILTKNENKKIVKHILYYATSKVFDSMALKSSKIIPIKDFEENEKIIFVLKDLVPSRMYKFKWESFNRFGLSNEISLSYNTNDIMPPSPPKILQFSPEGSMIRVNVTWMDNCSYPGSNSEIKDIIVNMKPLINQEGTNFNWQWTERNFTSEWDKSSAQFLIYLENPQIDYKIQVALRSPQGTSDYLSEIYKANVVLTDSLFLCFPRCSGNTFPSCFSFILFIYMISKLIRLYN